MRNLFPGTCAKLPPRWLILRVALAGWLLIASIPTMAQAESESPSRQPFQLLRYLEDYSYLKDSAGQTAFWDQIKYLPISRSRRAYLSLGGETRQMFEYFYNPLWGYEQPGSDGYYLQRYLLHADAHLGSSFRLFAQLGAGIEAGRNEGPRPIDEDPLFVHQLFTEVTTGETTRLGLRAGRQEVMLGSGRLVTIREGPNVRRSFDGVRAFVGTGKQSWSAFVLRPVVNKRGVFDNPVGARGQTLWGLYGVVPFTLGGYESHLDAYYLGIERRQTVFDQGNGYELRHSVGVRLWQRRAVDYNLEGVYQWGAFATGRISAWTLSADVGYTLENASVRPRLGLKAEMISGDRNPLDADLQTFNPLFPNGGYFGTAGLVGPANLRNVNPSLDLEITRKLTGKVDWDFYWRDQRGDGVYGPTGQLFVPGQGNAARYTGSLSTVEVVYAFNRHLSFNGIYSHFFRGRFFRENQPQGREVDFVTAFLTFKF
jgi:hypothetical protein